MPYTPAGYAPLSFEWDEVKAASNLARHGVPFEYAARVFSDADRSERADDRRDYGEARRIVYGRIEGRLHVVVYTMRGDAVRLISARRANSREQDRYGSD